MSPQAGLVLIEQIVPRLRAAIPKCVRPVAGEDAQELVQDATAAAAMMIHRFEETGRAVEPGHLIIHIIVHMKAGLRSKDWHRKDTPVTPRNRMFSLEDPVGFDEDLGEPIRLSEVIASNGDSPAARNIDWVEFLEGRKRASAVDRI